MREAISFYIILFFAALGFWYVADIVIRWGFI